MRCTYRNVKAIELERRRILEEYAQAVLAEQRDFRQKLRTDELEAQAKELERVMRKAEQEMQMKGAMNKSMEQARVLMDS